jgi:hypothetical protein
MRAFDPEVVDVIWRTVEPPLPQQVETHPLGCHRPRVPGRVCFRGILIRLVTARRGSTSRRSSIARIVGLDLDDVTVDGSLHKAPYGGEGTGPNPTDRVKLGWKWSVASERHGIPLGWAIDGAHRNDVRLLEPTLDTIDLRFTVACPDPLRVVLTLVGLLALALLRRGGRGRRAGRGQPAGPGAAACPG